MSAQLHGDPRPAPSTALPLAILVALALEASILIVRLAAPRDWVMSGRYWLLTSGMYAASALLFLMAAGDLQRRLPEREARGARIAVVGSAVFLGLSLATGLVNTLGTELGERAELVWQIQSYGFLAVYLLIAVGFVIAAGGFARMAPPATLLILAAVFLAPPPFLGHEIHEALGAASRYVYPVVAFAQAVLQAHLVREAAKLSTRELPAEPTAPFALLGSALRARVIAMFIMVAFTVFAMGGRSFGAMKVAMVGAPLVNLAAFLVFGIAALRAGRGLAPRLQLAFVAAGSAAAWCAGVLSVQAPAMFQILRGRGYGGFLDERNSDLAGALPLGMPLVATLSIVIALVAAGAYVRAIGHREVADLIGPRTTVVVVLVVVNVLVQVYGVPMVKTLNDLLVMSVLAAIAGVAALLVAARLFQRASEATSTTALPTATVVPPS